MLSWEDVEDRRRGLTASLFFFVSAEHGKRRKSVEFLLPGIDLGQDLGLGGIVVTSQLAVLHAEAITPKGEMSNRGLLSYTMSEKRTETRIFSVCEERKRLGGFHLGLMGRSGQGRKCCLFRPILAYIHHQRRRMPFVLPFFLARAQMDAR
jgi:hypothetical protein